MTSIGRYHAAAARSAARVVHVENTLELKKPAIEPILAQHKLPTAPSVSRPNGPKRDDDGPRKQYNCFSSSPSRPLPVDEEKEKPEEPEICARPAAIFHATTFVAASKEVGARRPVGLGPRPSMDRLRKPFKPLTISRPSRPKS